MQRPKRSDIALLFGLIGILTALALVFFGNTDELSYVWVGKAGVVVLAGPSAWLAGLACGGLFGHPGPSGWGAAALGAVMSTILGAGIAGTFVVPVLGTIVAPIALIEEAMFRPVILIAWGLLMTGLHILVLKSEHDMDNGG